MGEVAESPEVMPLNWKLQLTGGREIFLTRIQQCQTYGGTAMVDAPAGHHIYSFQIADHGAR